MTRIELSEKFKNQIKKVKDEAVMDRVKKEFKALLKDPTLGKPMRCSLKGFRSIRTAMATGLSAKRRFGCRGESCPKVLTQSL
jgi:hypothetical protein